MPSLRVVRKQPNSRMCLVCGLGNALGLQGAFYELENGELLGKFALRPEHQSYPGRLHGGLIAAVLDETIGRAIMIRHGQQVWGVTLEFTVRYRRPIPLEGELRVVGRITHENRRAFEGTGEVLLPDGAVAAEGAGKYLKLPIESIADFDPEAQEWRVVPSSDDPTQVEL